MELQRVIDERYSVRKYRDEPLSKAVLDQIIEAGMKAPTGKNAQPQRIYVISSKEAMEKLASVCRCTFGAPNALVVCYKEDEAWHSRFEEGVNCAEMDISIVTSFMMLKAWELGVGSCWVRYYDSREVAKALNIPEGIKVGCVLDLGYAAEDSVPLETMHNRPRPIEEVVKYL